MIDTNLIKTPSQIAAEIRRKMEENKYTVSELCQKYNNLNNLEDEIDKNAVSRCVNGKFKIINRRVSNICYILDVRTDMPSTLRKEEEEVINILNRAPRSKFPNIKTILEEIVDLSNGEKNE